VASLARQYVIDHPGVTIKTVWSPTVFQYSAVLATGTWPGDAYVDIVGPDFYTDSISPVSQLENGVTGFWRWFSQSYDTSKASWLLEPLNRCHDWDYMAAARYSCLAPGSFGAAQMLSFAKAHNKPFGLTETGCKDTGGANGPADDGTYPYYLANRLLEAQAKGMAIEFICPWDANTPATFVFTNGTRPAQLAAWRKYVLAMAANQAGTGGTVSTRSPAADSYVRDGSYAGNNFGTAATMTVKLDGASFARESYLRFNVSDLANASSVKVVLIPVGGGAEIATTTLSFELLSNDTWTETGITWNNRPTTSTVIGTGTGFVIGTPVELDVTSQAHAEAAGDGLLSLRIRSTTLGSQKGMDFGTRENTTVANQPVLEITTP
jgi:hypothetical protein